MAYLLQQLGQGPRARPEDWPLAVAGQRVQIIKREPGRGSRLKLGTEGWQQQTAAWRPAGGITGRVNWRHHHGGPDAALFPTTVPERPLPPAAVTLFWG